MKKLFSILVIAMTLLACGNSKNERNEELTNEPFGKEVLSFNGIKLKSPKDSVLSAIKANSSFGAPYSNINGDKVYAKVTIIAPHYQTNENIEIQGDCTIDLYENKTNKIEFRKDTGDITYFSSLCNLYKAKYGEYEKIGANKSSGLIETKCIWEGSSQRITIERWYFVPFSTDEVDNRIGKKLQRVLIIYEDLDVEKILKAKTDSINNIKIEQEKKEKQKEQNRLKSILNNQTI